MSLIEVELDNDSNQKLPTPSKDKVTHMYVYNTAALVNPALVNPALIIKPVEILTKYDSWR